MNYPQYPLLSGALISSVTGLLHNRIMTSNILEYLSLNQLNAWIARKNFAEKPSPAFWAHSKCISSASDYFNFMLKISQKYIYGINIHIKEASL